MRIDGEPMFGTIDFVGNPIDIVTENGMIVPW